METAINFYVPIFFYIWNIVGKIFGSYTEHSEFSLSKQILLFNINLDIFIPHSSTSTFANRNKLWQLFTDNDQSDSV